MQSANSIHGAESLKNRSGAITPELQRFSDLAPLPFLNRVPASYRRSETGMQRQGKNYDCAGLIPLGQFVLGAKCVFASFPALDGFPVASHSHRLAGPAYRLPFGPVPQSNQFLLPKKSILNARPTSTSSDLNHRVQPLSCTHAQSVMDVHVCLW
jgi:hypothetical protein